MSTQATNHTHGGPELKNGDRPRERKFRLVLQSAAALGAYEGGSIEYLFETGSARSSRELPRAPSVNRRARRPHHPVRQRPLAPASRRASVNPRSGTTATVRPSASGNSRIARQRPTRNSG